MISWLLKNKAATDGVLTEYFESYSKNAATGFMHAQNAYLASHT